MSTATTFAASLRQRFAGQLSEGETVLCSNLQESFRETLEGRLGFESEIVLLSFQLQTLRKFDFDADAALASGELDIFSETRARRQQTPKSPPRDLSPAEEAFIKDALGLIEWVVRNGVRFSLVLEILGHDISEIRQHEYSLEKTLADSVMPKVTGWAKRNADPVGETEEQN